VISNPGLFRIPVDAAVKGGVSSPRNPILFRMFGLIGIVERAGTGVSRSFMETERCGCGHPDIEQLHGPSRTVVRVVFRRGPPSLEEDVLKAIEDDGSTSLDSISKRAGVSRSKVYRTVKALEASGRIRRDGPARGGRWTTI
jgi:predicted HTH transcriptional regulator